MSDLTITLSGDVAETLRKLVAEQRYARPEDAVADAIAALEADRDPALDAWLRDTITTRANAYATDPSRALTADEVRAQIFGR